MKTCDFCRINKSGAFVFVSSYGTSICLECVDHLTDMYEEYEAKVRKARESVQMSADLRPKEKVKHNFQIIEGGESEV